MTDLNPPSRLPPEPVSIADMLLAGLRLYRAEIRSLVPAGCCLALPYAAASTALIGSISDLGSLEPGQRPPPGTVGQLLSLLWLYPCYFFTSSALTHQLVARSRGLMVGAGRSAVRGLALVLPLTLCAICMFFLVGLGLLGFLVPGVVLLVALSLFSLAPIVENVSPWRSLYRSYVLVCNGCWFRTAAAWVAMLTGWILATQLLSLLLSPLALFVVPDAPYAVGSLLVALLSYWASATLLLPLLLCCQLMLYHDLLLRQGMGGLPPDRLDQDVLDA